MTDNSPPILRSAMILRLIPLCFLLFVFIGAQAQLNIDSLQEVANNKHLPAKGRLDALYKLAEYYIQTHPDSTMYYADQQLALATASQDLAAQGSAMEMKGLAYESQNQPEEVFNSLHVGLRLCQQAGDSNCLGQILHRLGAHHHRTNNLDSATHYYQQSLAIGEAQNKPEQMIPPISGLGLIAQNKGNLDEALSYYQRSVALMEKINQRTSIGIPYRNMAFIYVQKGDYKNGTDYCQRSVDIFEMLGNKKEMAAGLNGLGLIAYYQKNYPEALANFQKAMDLYQELDDPRGVTTILGNRGMVYSAQGNLSKAIEDYTHSLKSHLELGNAIGAGNTLNSIGILYITQENYKSALQYLQQGLAVFDSISYRIGQAKVIQKIVYVHLRAGADSLALEMAKKGLELTREIGLKKVEADLLIELGDLYQRRGQYLEAKQNLLQALQIVEETLPNSAGRALNYLARLAIKQQSWREARDYAQEGLDLAKEGNNLLLINNAAEALWESQQALGQYPEALETYQLFVQTRDSLSSIENQRATIRYEYQEKTLADSLNNANVLALQVAETNRRTAVSYVLLGGLLLALVLGILLWNRFRLTRRQNQLIAEEKTKLDRAYVALNVANEKLKELDSFKSQFFTNISHEFRTPLTVIGGIMDQVENHPNQWLEKGSKIIRRNVNSLLSLINQILDLRKLESGQLTLQPIQADAVKFLRLGAASFESLAESKGVKLGFNSQVDQVMMDLDPDKLGQIQSNLLSNAIKFTPAKGEVEVKVDQPSAETLQLTVTDSGVGIPPEKLPLIFDRFYQVDGTDTREGEGTGIGLSLVKELTHLMEGNIRAESIPGQGSRFVLTLPIRQKAALNTSLTFEPVSILSKLYPDQAGFPSQTKGVSGELPRLLIVEDNPDIVEYLFACLEDQYEIYTAPDGEAGIEMALEYIPDLIISDVMMPKKDGFDLCQRLKTEERSNHIPIVLLTARADRDSRLEGLDLGADVYLAKPFDKQELLIQLRNLITVRKKLQQRYQSGQVLQPADNPITQKQDAFILKAREILEQHLDNHQFSVPDFCREIGMSKAQLHRKMKALTNLSTSIFVQNFRLEKAKQLLDTTDSPVAEIADLTGFSSSSYFSNLYKKKYGIPPGRSREK